MDTAEEMNSPMARFFAELAQGLEKIHQNNNLSLFHFQCKRAPDNVGWIIEVCGDGLRSFLRPESFDALFWKPSQFATVATFHLPKAGMLDITIHTPALILPMFYECVRRFCLAYGVEVRFNACDPKYLLLAVK